MKKLTVIFLTLFIILAILFGVSVGITGLTGKQNLGFKGDFWNMEPQKGNFGVAGTFKNIEIETISANTTITLTDKADASITYETNNSNRTRLVAELRGETLFVKEEMNGPFGYFFNFGFNATSTLNISIPAKKYENTSLKSVSGDVKIAELEADNFTFNSTSGNATMNMFATNMSFNSTSGDINVTNCTNKVADSLKMNVISGNCSFRNFKTNKYDLCVTSGDIRVDGISGAGKINTTSGDVSISYAEWNDDLEIHSTSGDFDIQLPEGSGVNTDFSRVSGEIRLELDNSNVTISSGGTAQNGGSNRHNVKINLISGNVRFKN